MKSAGEIVEPVAPEMVSRESSGWGVPSLENGPTGNQGFIRNRRDCILAGHTLEKFASGE